MNVNVMRAIDKYGGPIICLFLLFLRLLSRNVLNLYRNSPQKECKNIVFIKFFGIGSILLTAPSLRILKENYPNAKVAFLTASSNQEICEILPSVDAVFCLKTDTFWNLISGLINAIYHIRKNNYETIVDLEFITNFSCITTFLITLFRSQTKAVGFLSPIKWRNSVYDLNVSFDHSRHITLIFLKVIKSLCGHDTPIKKVSFLEEKIALLKCADTNYFEKLLEVNTSLEKCKHFICININATVLSYHRRWPKEYFAKLISELIKEPAIAIFLIGTSEDLSYVSDLYRELPQNQRLMNICGKTSLRQLIGLFSKSNFLITNDSGPLHLAQVIGLSTISFFGPETPYLYGPLEEETHDCFYEDLYCSPCLNIYNSKRSDCTNNICLQFIKPERVLALIKDKYLSKWNENLEVKIPQ